MRRLVCAPAPANTERISAYVISEVTVLDEESADRYRELAAASIARYHGRYLSRGLRPELVEGSWPAEARLMIVEFPSMAAAREWYDSPEYAEALSFGCRRRHRGTPR